MNRSLRYEFEHPTYDHNETGFGGLGALVAAILLPLAVLAQICL